ncbi:MAG: DUF4244 domain-containing protein [Micrococcales bacterium]|nr:DUF4244 domain-containing protein [Micrococcales bacterium]
MSTTLVHRCRTGSSDLVRRLRASAEHGMTTAEYAVGTLAACAFAAVLLAVIKSGIVKNLIEVLLKTALAVIK